MAKIFIGKCAGCHYISGKVYAGPLLFDSRDRIPALDIEKNEIVTLIKADQPGNPSIIPYTDERLKKGASKDTTAPKSGPSSHSADDNNYCPKCCSFSLRFEFRGFAD